MTETRPLLGGIIAAGEGSRLRRDGWTMPKPLVPIAGVPLVERVIANFAAAGIRSLVIILNEQERACAEWIERRFPELELEIIVKTTPSSFVSFREVTGTPRPGRMLVSTVDAWTGEADFVDFVERAARRPDEATVLGVTPLVADERPLWVEIDADSRVARIGGAASTLVTAGFYLVPERVRRMAVAPGLGRLREFLAWLLTQGEPMYGEVITTVVDVDRAEDVALATAVARRSVSGASQ